MKRIYKYLFVFLGSLFIFPLVSSAECSYERQAELSKIAANVKFSYTYEMQEAIELRALFKIYITNLTKDIYVRDEYNDLTIAGVSEKTVNYGDVSPAVFQIYSNDSSCKGELLTTKYVNMPTYNSYSQRQECQENPDFEFCEIWNAKPESETQFNDKMTKYQKQKTTDNSEKTEEKDLLYFFQRNKTTLIIVAICVFVLITIAILRRKYSHNI